MKTNNQRRQHISTHQVNRVTMIIAQQWEEVMSIVQERAERQRQERRVLVHQAIQHSNLRRQAA
jgi:hypothetical protein